MNKIKSILTHINEYNEIQRKFFVAGVSFVLCIVSVLFTILTQESMLLSFFGFVCSMVLLIVACFSAGNAIVEWVSW